MGGGALASEGGTGMCHGHDLLFSGQSVLPSLSIYHQCAIDVTLSNFQCVLQNFGFLALFLAEIQALQMQIFKIFVPKPPHFSRKICSIDPTFETCPTHTHPKKG